MSTTQNQKREIKGAVAIVTLSDGRVTASYGDFERSAYGGFRLPEAQAIRATDMVRRRAVIQFVGPAMAEWLSAYTVSKIWDDMRDKGGARITVIPIGYEGEDAEVIVRRSDR